MKKTDKISLIFTILFSLIYINKIFIPDLIVHNANFLLCTAKFLLLTFLFFKLIANLLLALARQNLLQRKYAIDLTFIGIFFLLLVIPMSKITNFHTSYNENRKLAVYKPFWTNGNIINLNYPKDFEEWFSDNFRFRNKIIRWRTQLFYTLSSNRFVVNNIYIYKKNGFLLGYKTKEHAKAYSPNIDKKIIKNLTRLQHFCDEQNIKLYIVFIPSVSYYYSKYDLKFKKAPKSNFTGLIDYAKKNNTIKIIYPEEDFRQQADGKYIYFKTDHHLTDYGAYILYKKLINEMKQDLPLLHITPLSEFNISKNTKVRAEWTRTYTDGWVYINSNINAPELLTTEYEYYDYKYPERINLTGKYDTTAINPDGHYKLMLIGNSYVESIKFFLHTSFKETKKFRISDIPAFRIKKYEDIARTYKPDAMIIMFHVKSPFAFMY